MLSICSSICTIFVLFEITYVKHMLNICDVYI